MRRLTKAALLIAGYLALVTAPVFVLLADPLPVRRHFGTEMSVALGFAALGMLGMQFGLTARFRRIASPFGTDILYYFHRYLGYLVVVVLAAHVGILVAGDPALLLGLTPGAFSRPLALGVASFVAVVAIVVTSVARARVGMEYDRWRLLHAVLALGAAGGGLGHALDYGTHIGLGWTRLFWIAYGSAGAFALAYVRVVKPWRQVRRPWTVVENREEVAGVHTLALEPDGHGGMPFRAGQFAWVDLDASPFRMVEHPFSVSSAPSSSPRLEFTIQPVGDFTERAVGLEPGTRAYVEGPHGIFTVEDHPASRFVLIAGGIGIAPIVSIVRDRAAKRDPRPFLLLYATRTLEGAAFREELEALTAVLDLRVVHVVEEPPVGWTGEVGRIDGPLLDRHLPVDRAEPRYLMCGPEAMQHSVEHLLHAAGVPSGRVHTEVFHWV